MPVVSFFFLGSVGGLALDRLTYILTELWLAAWVEGATKPVGRLGHTFAPQSDGRSSQVEYLKVYACVLILSFLFCLGRSLWIVQGGGRCSVKLFKAMIARVVLAPMSYFESTPSGRILNRVSYDVETMDITLSLSSYVDLTCLLWMVFRWCYYNDCHSSLDHTPNNSNMCIVLGTHFNVSKVCS